MGSVAGKRVSCLWRLFLFDEVRGGDCVALGVGVGMIDAGCWDSGAQSVIETGCAWGARM